jgi:(S)-sulfolactate dehydrogenase
MLIVIPEVMDAAAVESLKKQFTVHFEPTLVDDRPRMLKVMADATGIIVKERTQVDRELLAATPQLRVVGRLGVGLDNIDQPACKERNIAVFPATGANARSVAEYVICTALMLMRPNAYVSTAEVAAGSWPQKKANRGGELDGKTLGIVAMGAIGQTVARMARCLGLHVLAWAPSKSPDDPMFRELGVKRVELDELLAASDIVSLHVPLTKETRGLLGRERIMSMKKGARLINTARGGIVDDAALIEALKSGHLGGAAIDVFDPEPLPAGSVYENPPPTLLLTPHVAGGTIESTERRGTVVAERVSAYLTAAR